MSRARGIVARVGLAIAIFTLIMALGIAGFAVISINGEIPYPVLIAAALFSVNALFFFLIGAPTAVGRTRLDEIEGLNMYLSVAEKDRMNMLGMFLETCVGFLLIFSGHALENFWWQLYPEYNSPEENLDFQVGGSPRPQHHF